MDKLEQQIEALLNELHDDELNKLAIHLKMPRAHEGIQAPLGVKISDLQRMNFIKWVKGTGNVQKAGIYLGIIEESALPKVELSKQQRTIENAKLPNGGLSNSQNGVNKVDKYNEKWYQTNTFKGAVIALVVALLGGGIPAWFSLGNKTDHIPTTSIDIFADVSKDGSILRSNNFPWEIRKSNDQDGNILYTIVDRRGDATAVSIVPDNPKYTVYQSYGGMVIKFTCAEEKISNFTIKLKY
jgi:hypothetical protein